jgi:hypothetical protein
VGHGVRHQARLATVADGEGRVVGRCSQLEVAWALARQPRRGQRDPAPRVMNDQAARSVDRHDEGVVARQRAAAEGGRSCDRLGLPAWFAPSTADATSSALARAGGVCMLERPAGRQSAASRTGIGG